MSSTAELVELTSELRSRRGWVAIDTETTGLFPYQDDELRGISVTFESRNYYFSVSHADERVARPALRQFFRSLYHHELVFHNATFDWAFLSKLNLGFLPRAGWDTQIGAWLEDENLRHGLKEQAALWFGDDAKDEQTALKKLFKGKTITECLAELKAEYPDAKIKDLREESRARALASKRSWDNLEACLIAKYAAKDTELTMKLFERQREIIGSEVMARELKVQRALFEMMQTGIRVNPEGAREQLETAEKRIGEIEAEFEINLASPKQLAELLFETWGLPDIHDGSTARHVLEELEGAHPGVDLILEHRRLAKAIGGYYRPLLERIGDDGRIHASFSQTATVTGRLSCSTPNLQTIPRSDTLAGVRDLFLAEDGLELWEYDLSSAELRVMAGWAGETAMLSALEEGRNLHEETAAAVFGPNFTPLQYRLAKNLNYGFAYGIKERKFATYMVAGTGNPVTCCNHWTMPPWLRPGRCRRCTVCAAGVILDGYRATYPDLVQLMDGLSAIAKRDGVLPLHVEGRYRHFRSPGIRVGYHAALNAIVQGGIGEFMRDVMVQIVPSVRDYAWLCLQVHDSLVFEVLPGRGPELGVRLQDLADDINPFEARMVWDAREWSDHE